MGIAYIGAGRRANQLTGLPPAGRIVAVADVNLQRAEEFAAQARTAAHAGTIANCSTPKTSTR